MYLYIVSHVGMSLSDNFSTLFQIPYEYYTNEATNSKIYALSDASFAKLNFSQPKNYKNEEEKSNAEATSLVGKSQDAQIINLKNEPTVTVVLHSNAALNEHSLEDEQQLLIAVNEDKKSKTVFENQNDVTVFIMDEENTTNMMSNGKKIFSEIECNCSLGNHHYKTADIGCGSADFTVKTVAVGSYAAVSTLVL